MLWKSMKKQPLPLGQPRRTYLGINLYNLGYDFRRLYTARIFLSLQDTSDPVALVVFT